MGFHAEPAESAIRSSRHSPRAAECTHLARRVHCSRQRLSPWKRSPTSYKRCPRLSHAWTLSENIFEVSRLERETEALERLQQEPDFWSDPTKAQETVRKLSQLRGRTEPYRDLRKRFEDIEELASLLEGDEDPAMRKELVAGARQVLKDLDALEIQTLLGGPHDPDPAILTISAGAGGTESCDWAEMLLRMYTRWAQRRGFSFEIGDETPGDVTGYRNVSGIIEGPYAYGNLRSERGVHRLVRISPFDASGRRHTSFAMVEVIPVVAEGEVSIRTEDLRVDTFRSSGAGGQHVNKTDSAVRITHIPTGIVVTCQNERSQHKNRAVALRVLESRLAELERDKTEQKLKLLRGEVPPAEWGHQIRSYVLHPYTMVKDHRTGFETGDTLGVLDGEIDGFIEAFLRCSASGGKE